jgi:hypothetical protein
MFFASGLLALLPSFAHRLNGSPIGSRGPLGCFGCFAVLGSNVVVSTGIATFGLTMVAAGALPALWQLAAVILIGDAA